ncbi:MAG: PAS domain-containing sensor histidine kinase, partial [Alphaproteobacteria bacterium]|nr:PAS domain-containing sensor histidine kinase [Alphaproteobacteria bacterium]
LIATEVDRIAQLVDRMQQLGSAATVVSAPCNLHEAIRNAVSTVRTSRGDEVETVEEFDPSLPLVLADRAALEQILINLIANACDASRGGASAQVVVRTRFTGGLVFNAIRLGKATRLPIEVSVIDNGPGIDPALRDHVFEPFVSSKPQGQGLGLALVRKLVRDMGGRIAHERDDRAGLTLFRINLPVASQGEDE